MEAVVYSGTAIGSYEEDEMEFSEATLQPKYYQQS